METSLFTPQTEPKAPYGHGPVELSIVTVCKNDLEGLQKTLQSIQRQKHISIQLIVMDGQSQDGSLEFLQDYEQSFLKKPCLTNEKHQGQGINELIISSKNDRGPYDAMNHGFQMAKGQWLHFLNAGDHYLHANALHDILNDFKSVHDAANGDHKANQVSVDFIYGDIQRAIPHLGKTDWPQKLMWQWGIFNNICHQAILYNTAALRECFPQSPFDLHYEISADCHLLLTWQQLRPKLKPLKIHQNFVVYRGGGISQQQAAKALGERRRSFRQCLSPWLWALNRLNLMRQDWKLKRQQRQTIPEKNSNKPKVFVLALRRHGGSVRYAKAMLDHLQDVDLHIWASKESCDGIPNGAELFSTYKSSWGFAWSSITKLPIMMCRLFHLLNNKAFDLVYMPYIHYWSFAFLPIFKWFGIKVLCTVHDGKPHSGDGLWLDLFNAKRCLHSADHAIFLCDYAKHRMSDLISNSCSTSVIPHGLLNMGKGPHTPKPYPQSFKLLFLGRVCHYKGIDIFMDALAHLDQSKIHSITIAGQQSRHIKADLALAISEHEKRGFTFKLVDTWLNENEMKKQLEQHHLMILPYREATQSGILTLGVSHAIPMVCTNVGGLPEQLQGDEAVFTKPQAADLARGIDSITGFPERYLTLQERLMAKRQGSSWTEHSGALKKAMEFTIHGQASQQYQRMKQTGDMSEQESTRQKSAQQINNGSVNNDTIHQHTIHQHTINHDTIIHEKMINDPIEISALHDHSPDSVALP
jgi:glycosyltransferase involved in cell wall biosynthesis